MSDDVTAEAVKESLTNSFMKKREGDVNLKAAQMIALELLQEGWRELERTAAIGQKSSKGNQQVAL